MPSTFTPQKIFGGNAIGNSGQEIVGIPGSTAAGTPQYSTDGNVLQNNSFLNGAASMVATVGTLLKQPIQESQTAPAFVMSQNIAAIQQYGILPWNAGIYYNQNAMVLAPNSTKVYISLVDNNYNNALTNSKYWTQYGDIQNLQSATTTKQGTVLMATGSTANVAAPINSPAFTGVPTAPTAAAGTNTTQIATTAFVKQNAAPINSPAFTGVPTAPTAAAGTNTTQIATTAFVKQNKIPTVIYSRFDVNVLYTATSLAYIYYVPVSNTASLTINGVIIQGASSAPCSGFVNAGDTYKASGNNSQGHIWVFT
jgi:hypothetical protein